MTQEKALGTISCERKANIQAEISTHETTGVKEFVGPSVTNFDPNYLWTGRTEWAKKNLEHIFSKLEDCYKCHGTEM